MCLVVNLKAWVILSEDKPTYDKIDSCSMLRTASHDCGNKKAFCAHLCERRRHNVGIARVNYTKCMSSSRGRSLTFLPSHVNSSGVPIYPNAWSQMMSHLGKQAQQQTQLAKCRESKVSGFSLHSLSRLFSQSLRVIFSTDILLKGLGGVLFALTRRELGSKKAIMSCVQITMASEERERL